MSSEPVYGQTRMSPEPAPEPALVDLSATPTAVVAAVIPADQIVDHFDRSFGQVAAVIADQAIGIAGAAFALYHGLPGETVDLEVGFPVGRAVRPDMQVRPGELPGGRVARLVHHGAFDQLGSSWGRLQEWITEQGLTPGGDFWEVYVTEPSPDMDPADLRTELNWPVEE